MVANTFDANPAAAQTPAELVTASRKIYEAYQRAITRAEAAEKDSGKLRGFIVQMQGAMQALPKRPKLKDYADLVRLINGIADQALSEEENS